MITLKNVAIIMDGNGRWANQRGYPRFFGHIRGCKVVSDIVEHATQLGLQSLCLYAFSTENWKRPNQEIEVLFRLFKKFLLKEQKKMLKNGVRLSFVGDLSTLDPSVQKVALEVSENTKHGKNLNLVLAVNYGAKAELLRAFERTRTLPGKITEKDVEDNLWNPEMPVIDLLIRTGGDQRISNFLLWQSAYAEMYFEQGPWPEFSKQKFESILRQCSTRERRFGDVGSSMIKEISPA